MALAPVATMSSYVYELPTTGSVVFSEILVDETGKYTHAIANATLARSNLRAALKESKRTDEGEKDHLKIIKVVDEYLPHLYAIIECVATGDLQLRQEAVGFSWRSTFSANLLNTSPRQTVTGLYADLAFTLITYASALSNLAATSVTSLGAYETERAITDADRKTKDDKLNFAVQLLLKASGIFSHVAENVISQWERTLIEIQASAGGSSSKPVDLSRELVSSLSRFALAEAQTLAIRKLLSKSAYDSTLNPGPPLPRSHPPPGLVAKLSLNALDCYSSASSLAKSARGSGTASGEVTKDLTRWLADEAALTAALSHKWLGVDAGEKSSTTGKAGEAVGFLSWAKDELEGLKDGGHGIAGLGRKKKRKERVADEISRVAAFLNHYKKLNNTVHFETVPTVATLQSMIPTGTAAVTPKPFMPPPLAFRAAKASTMAELSQGIADSTLDNEESPAPQSAAAVSSSPVATPAPRQYF